MVPMLMMSAILLTIIIVKVRVCRSLARSDDEIKIFAPLLQPHTQFLYQQHFVISTLCSHILCVHFMASDLDKNIFASSLRSHPLSDTHVLH